MSDRKWNVVRLWLLVLIVAGFGTIDRAVAQDQDRAAKVEEIINRIKETMKKVDESLFTAGSSRTGRGEEGKDEVKKILEKTRQDHRQIIRDIDELIRNVEYQMSQSSSSPDRRKNKPKEQQKPREENPQDSDLKKNPSAKEQEKTPKDGKPNADKPKQEDAQNRRPEQDPERVDHRDTSGRWGLLPPKVQEEILNSNVEDFPQKYRKWLEEYYRTVNKQR